MWCSGSGVVLGESIPYICLIYFIVTLNNKLFVLSIYRQAKTLNKPANTRSLISAFVFLTVLDCTSF